MQFNSKEKAIYYYLVFSRICIVLNIVVLCADRSNIKSQESEIYIEIDWVI